VLSIWPSLAPAQGGAIDGVVTTKAAASRPIPITIDQKFCGNEMPDEAVMVGAAGGLANAVVTVRGVRSRLPQPEPTVANTRCRFVPRVQIARPNLTLRTTSQDPMLHTTNVQDAAGRTLFNLAIPRPGITLSRPIARAGVYRVGCNVHPWMRAWLFVTDDMAAVTGPDGRFVLPDVPPGSYELTVWHEALKGEPLKVMVGVGQTARVRVEVR
jgi:hypothetical protein